MKTNKYHQDIGKHYNMEEIIMDDTDEIQYAYKCKNNRLLDSTSHRNEFKQEFEHYESSSCEVHLRRIVFITTMKRSIRIPIRNYLLTEDGKN